MGGLDLFGGGFFLGLVERQCGGGWVETRRKVGTGRNVRKEVKVWIISTLVF